jgi:hypothetical protein
VTIHFQFSVDDVCRISQEQQSYISRRFADPTPSKVTWYFLIPLTIAAIGVISGKFLMGVLAYGLIWGVTALGNRWHRHRFHANYYREANLPLSLLPFQLDLLPDRLVLSNAKLVHQHFWHGFHFLRETPAYFHLHFSPVSSLAIPKSVFTSDAERESFRMLVKSHQPATGSA